MLKFYCKDCFYFIVKYNIFWFVWEDEETDHKISSLFFPIVIFFKHPALQLFLRIARSTFLQSFQMR